MKYFSPFLLLVAAFATPAFSQLAPTDRAALFQRIDARAGHFGEVSRKIW